jgi:hypothetical protein
LVRGIKADRDFKTGSKLIAGKRKIAPPAGVALDAELRAAFKLLR